MRTPLLAPLGAAAALCAGPWIETASAFAPSKDAVRAAIHQADFRADVLQMFLPTAALVVLALIVPMLVERWLDGEVAARASGARPWRLGRRRLRGTP